MRLILAMAWSWCPQSAREPSGRPQHERFSDSRADDTDITSARRAFRFCFEVATGINEGVRDRLDSKGVKLEGTRVSR